MTSQGVSERRALALVRMSASSLRYTPAPDTNAALRARIVALAHQHRRYGAGMIYLKLRQAGALVNHKRVERLYTEARLQVRRRRRKKIPVADRQPLVQLTPIGDHPIAGRPDRRSRKHARFQSGVIHVVREGPRQARRRHTLQVRGDRAQPHRARLRDRAVTETGVMFEAE